MQRRKTFSKLLATFRLGLLGVVMLLAPASFIRAQDDPRGFDPLELPQDSINIPATRPAIVPRSKLSPTMKLVGGNAGAILAPTANAVDSNFQSSLIGFRVQLMNADRYAEAKRASQVAMEIFDQPVVVDYEVPYYKVRVGDFSTRADAERYQLWVQRAGYQKAWVVPFTRTKQETSADSISIPTSDTLSTAKGQ